MEDKKRLLTTGIILGVIFISLVVLHAPGVGISENKIYFTIIRIALWATILMSIIYNLIKQKKKKND